MSKRTWIESALTDARTGEVHTMEFHVRIEGGAVRAEFVARKLRRFWK